MDGEPRSRAPWLFAGGLALGLVAMASAGYASRAALARAKAAAVPTLSGVGPALRAEVPRDAVTASSVDELRGLVADPKGPRTIVLEARRYELDLVVRRPLTLLGRPGTTIQGTGHGTVVTIEADDVVLDGLVVRGSGRRHTLEDAAIKAKGARVRVAHVKVEDSLFGISLQECKACIVEASHVVGRDDDPSLRGDAIKLWESTGSTVRGCLVEDSRDIVVWYSRHVTLEDNVVTRSRYGAHFMYAHDSVVRRSRVVGNVVGVFIMYSSRVLAEDNLLAGARGAAGMGLGFKDADDVTVRRNRLVANTVGAYLDSTPRSPGKTLEVSDNVVALNEVGVRLHGSEKGARFLGNDFHENVTMVEVDAGGSALGIDFEGNRFSSYEGYDLDGDGYGDVAYLEKALSSDLTARHPALRFFHGTAAMGAIDGISRAVPVMQSKVVLRDGRPRMGRLAP